jgi:hypothetical protein
VLCVRTDHRQMAGIQSKWGGKRADSWIARSHTCGSVSALCFSCLKLHSESIERHKRPHAEFRVGWSNPTFCEIWATDSNKSKIRENYSELFVW